jgi:hypothetical protein
MNLGDICAIVYDTMGYPKNPEGVVQNRIIHNINNLQRQILSMRGMTKLRRGVLSFTSTAGVPTCTLPQAATHVAVIVDRTNTRPLTEVSIQEVRGRDPGLTFSSSVPDTYAIINYSAAVAADPTSASALYAVSDDATDTGGISAYIEGTVTGGYPRRETAVLTGTTAVQLGSLSTWEHITKFYLSAGPKGNVTLRQGSGGGTELARITAGRSYARYTQLWLQGTPGSAITYYADTELAILNMVAPTDEPLLPEDFHYILEAGALMREYVKREKPTLWKIESLRWTEGIGALHAFCGRKGGVPDNFRPGFSQLGPYFPAGS